VSGKPEGDNAVNIDWHSLYFDYYQLIYSYSTEIENEMPFKPQILKMIFNYNAINCKKRKGLSKTESKHNKQWQF
jgi:hypothetical protein